MKIEQLQQALDRYGSDRGRWPEALKADAQALIAGDPGAAKIAETAARLDAVLAESMRPLPVDASFLGRLVAGLGNGAGGHDVTVRPTTRLIAWAGAAMVAFLVTGYAVGLALPVNQGDDTLAGLMFGNSSTSDTSDSSDTGSVL